MFGRNQVPDQTINTRVSQRLARAGVSTMRLAVRNGEVTITGLLKYEAQRRPALSVASAVEGVRSVIDRMTIKAPEKKIWN